MPSLNDEILSAVSQVESQDSRVILTLMARVHTDILTRLDKIYSDEQRIKSIALNGLSNTHHEDHTWLSKNRHGLENVLAFSVDRKKLGGYCDFAARKLEEEKHTQQTKRSIFSGVTTHILTSAISIAVTLIALGFVTWIER